MTLAQLAQIYDARASIPFDGSTSSDEVEGAVRLLATLNPSRECRVLDIGCGPGWFLAALHRAGYRNLCGVDISAKSLRKAAGLLRGTGTVFFYGDVGTVPLGTFQIVTALNACFGCFGPEGDSHFVRDAYRALATGGTMIMTYVGEGSARARVGEFAVSYAQVGSPVLSSVQLSSDESHLILKQTIEGSRIPEERIAVQSSEAVDGMLLSIGFQNIRRFDGSHPGIGLPFVDIVTASRLS